VTPQARVIRTNMKATFGVLFLSVGEALLILGMHDERAFDDVAARFDDLKGRAHPLFRVSEG